MGGVGGESGSAAGYNCLFISKHCCPYFRPCLLLSFLAACLSGPSECCFIMRMNEFYLCVHVSANYVCVRVRVCVLVRVRMCVCVCVHMGANEFDVNCNFMRISFTFSCVSFYTSSPSLPLALFWLSLSPSPSLR